MLPENVCLVLTLCQGRTFMCVSAALDQWHSLVKVTTKIINPNSQASEGISVWIRSHSRKLWICSNCHVLPVNSKGRKWSSQLDALAPISVITVCSFL